MSDFYCRKADKKSVCKCYAIGQVPKGFYSSRVQHHWPVIVKAGHLGLTQTKDNMKQVVVLLECRKWFKRPVNNKAAAVS